MYTTKSEREGNEHAHTFEAVARRVGGKRGPACGDSVRAIVVTYTRIYAGGGGHELE